MVMLGVRLMRESEEHGACRGRVRKCCRSEEIRYVLGVEREVTRSDRKAGMSSKRVVDHEIPSLASSLSQG
jgi:hypothetical protein